MKRRLGWILQLLVLAGLGWVLNDPRHIISRSNSRPYRICLEHPSQSEVVQKTLSALPFPSNATFELTSPSGRVQTAPQLWNEINWDALTEISWPTEDSAQELFKLPIRVQSQDVFWFHLAPLSEIRHSSILAHLLKENQIRLFLFGPDPLPAISVEPPAQTQVQPFFQISAIHANQGVDIQVDADGLPDSIHLFWDDQLSREWPPPESPLEKRSLKHSLSLPPGTHVLWAKSGNHFTHTTIDVPAPLRVWTLDSEDENAYLETLLKAQGIEVFRNKNLPEKWPPYSILVLGGATASHLSVEESARIQHFVQKEGGALAFFQGEPDFLTSTWNQWLPLQNIKTAIAPPSSPDPESPEKLTPPAPEKEKDLQEGEVTGKKKIEESSLCLLLVMDRSGSMQGEKLELAKQSAIACLSELKEDDLFGIITFNQFPQWILYPTLVSKQSEIVQAVHRIQAEGDTFIYPALLGAQTELRKQKVSAKHIILLSDGYSQRANYRQMVEELVQDQITLSTIGIGTDFDHSLMANLAEWGCGRFYFTADFAHIAKYVTLDTRKVVEEIRDPLDKPKKPDQPRKKPKIVPESPEKAPPSTEKKEVFPVIGKGPLFKTESPPPVLKYRQATASEKAYIYAEVQGQPLLAVERRGTGKVLHFIGRFEETWAPEWLQWKRMAPFWGQALKHIALEKKEFPELCWIQESTSEKTRICVSFPTILDTAVNYFLTISGKSLPLNPPLEGVGGGFDSPTTLRFECPFPGSGFYSFSGSSSLQPNLFSFKGLLYTNREKETKPFVSTISMETDSEFFLEPWSYQPLPPLYSELVTRYFPIILSLFVGILWIALFLRYRNR